MDRATPTIWVEEKMAGATQIKKAQGINCNILKSRLNLFSEDK